jgi:hypothetical protein
MCANTYIYIYIHTYSYTYAQYDPILYVIIHNLAYIYTVYIILYIWGLYQWTVRKYWQYWTILKLWRVAQVRLITDLIGSPSPRCQALPAMLGPNQAVQTASRLGCFSEDHHLLLGCFKQLHFNIFRHVWKMLKHVETGSPRVSQEDSFLFTPLFKIPQVLFKHLCQWNSEMSRSYLVGANFQPLG